MQDPMDSADLLRRISRFASEVSTDEWNQDPESWHAAESSMRSKLIQYFADGGKLDGDAREACRILADIGKRRDLKRWFS